MRLSLPKILCFAGAAVAMDSHCAVAGTSGQISISGNVALVNEIVVSASGNTNLNITDGENGKQVATVTERSNNATGYQVYISSANNGELRHSGNSSYKTTYQVQYDTNGTYKTPSSTPTSVKNVTSLGALTTNSSPVTVKVTAAPSAPAGTYTDTITLSIVQN